MPKNTRHSMESLRDSQTQKRIRDMKQRNTRQPMGVMGVMKYSCSASVYNKENVCVRVNRYGYRGPRESLRD